MSALSLRRRLAELEAKTAHLPTVDQQQRDAELRRACSAVFDVLELHYWREWARRSYPPTSPHYNQLDVAKLAAAAERIEAGAPTDDDRAAMEALPAFALAVFAATAAELIVLASDICSGKFGPSS